MKRLVLVALVLAVGCKKKQDAEQEQGSAEGSSSGEQSSEKKPSKPLASKGDALDGATALAVGADRACALSDNKLWCWDPGAPAAEVTTPATLTNIAGAECGLTDNGDLYCWGSKEVKAAADSLGGQITVGAGGVCVGHRMTVKCYKIGDAEPYAKFDWAGVDKIVHGDHRVCSVVNGGMIECVDLTSKEPHNEPLHGPEDAQVLGMAGNLSCAVLQKGGVECWTDPGSRKAVPNVKDASDVAVGPTGDACAIVGNGFVTCWHPDPSNGTTIDASVKQIGGVRGATAIGVGNGFGCAIGAGDKVACWGKASKEPETAQAVAKK